MKQKRLENRMTQVDVATKSGISSKYYGSIENGKNSPSIEKLSSIAKVLGCSLHFLLNDRMDDMEKRVTEEEDRLQQIFNKTPRDKLSLVEGLITQAARLRVLLDDNWKDIIENGEYEKFKKAKIKCLMIEKDQLSKIMTIEIKHTKLLSSNSPIYYRKI